MPCVLLLFHATTPDAKPLQLQRLSFQEGLLVTSALERERERFITSFPAISGLIRCVEDPF